ncbi:MAG: hypothetical protein AAFU73_10930 [Planctomycetota bacterium]
MQGVIPEDGASAPGPYRIFLAMTRVTPPHRCEAMAMTLQAKLDSIAEASAAKLPAETRATMHDATEALIQSGAAARAPKVGDPSPELELDGPEDTINLGIERADSPVVLTWFRGNW